jgi:hypothetical chaperone protein
VEGAKIALTETERHVIDCARIEAGLSAELDRALFDAAIAASLARINVGIEGLLQDAGVSPAQVDTLFFTGGSSGIPALRASVAALLPNARQVEGNRFGGIGSGLAIEAHKRYG